LQDHAFPHTHLCIIKLGDPFCGAANHLIFIGTTTTMKKLLISLLAVLPLLLLPLDSYADKDKGPSDRAYDKANDNASFNRDNDKKKKGKSN